MIFPKWEIFSLMRPRWTKRKSNVAKLANSRDSTSAKSEILKEFLVSDRGIWGYILYRLSMWRPPASTRKTEGKFAKVMYIFATPKKWDKRPILEVFPC